jgi:hypothetical protein
MLDQDPREKALSESIFDHPPASSVAAASPAVVSNAALRMLLNVSEVGTSGQYTARTIPYEHKRERLTGYSIEISGNNMSARDVEGTLEIVFVRQLQDGTMHRARAITKAVAVRAMGVLDDIESTTNSSGPAEWIVRLTGSDGSLIGSTGSTGELADVARSNDLFAAFMAR